MRKILLKLCSVITMFVFVCSTIVNAAPAMPAPAFMPEQIRLQSMDELMEGLPSNVCEVDKRWLAPKAEDKKIGEFPLVVLLS